MRWKVCRLKLRKKKTPEKFAYLLQMLSMKEHEQEKEQPPLLFLQHKYPTKKKNHAFVFERFKRYFVLLANINQRELQFMK